MLNGMVFVISIASQLTYFYDAQSGLVEKCILEVPATLKVGFTGYTARKIPFMIPFLGLCGLSFNFHIHVSVID
jgi:hypothetical protein